MSTLRINNIEAKSVPASPTIDEKIKLTNSSGDVLVHVDGKTSGITTIGINTTAGNITFDANSNVVVTGIITATKFVGTIEPTNLTVSGDLTIPDKIIHSGDTNTAIRFPAADTITAETGGSERLRIGSNGEILTGGATSEPLYPAYTTARKVQAEIKGAIDVGQTRHHGSLAINCTNENASLHLIRSQANNTSGIDAGVIAFTVYDGTDFHQCARIMASRDATGGNNDTPGRLTFHTTADGASTVTERLRIASGGEVSIGGFAPTAGAGILQIAGGLRVAGSGSASDTNTPYIYRTSGADNLNFATSGTERLRIASGGDISATSSNITQSVTSGAAILKVQTTATSGDALIQASGEDSSGNTRMIQMRTDAGASQYRIISSDTSYPLALCTGNSPRILIASNSAATSIGGANTFNAMLTTQGDVSGGLLMLKAAENTSRLFVTGNDSSGCEVNLYDDAGVQKGILGVASNEFFIKAPNTGAGLGFYTHNGSSIGARLSISAGGNVSMPNGSVFSINKSSVTGNFHQEINYKAGQKGCIYLENHAYYSAQPPLRFNNTDTNNVRAMEDVQFERAGALKGYIRISSGSVTYSTSGSDERLKKNFENWDEEVLPNFKTLKPKLFNWIDDDDGTDKNKGFIAQDNLDKFPEAYNLTESTDRYYFNPSGMVHYLMKAMQESAIKIETLEAEVAALKSS